VGVSRERIGFLRIWQGVLADDRVDKSRLKGRDPTQPFNIPDQDALNIAVMQTAEEVSTVGPDGMCLQYGGGGYILAHSIGKTKPWNHCYSWRVIRSGTKLRRVDRLYLSYAMRPIALYSRARYCIRKMDRNCAAVLSRFVG
jgi:hypothetical protein